MSSLRRGTLSTHAPKRLRNESIDMRTLTRSALALIAAVVAPPAIILVPEAAHLLLSDAASFDPHAWIRFGRIAAVLLMTASISVVFLGLPVFLLLLWRRAIRWWSALIAGFVLGCLPIAIGTWPARNPELQTTAAHWDGEKMVNTMIDGVPTLAGWIRYLEVTALFGGFGAVGGLAFWAVWRALQPIEERSPSEK